MEAPPELLLNFSEPVALVGSGVTLRTSEGGSVPLDIEVQPGGGSIRAVPGEKLTKASYVVEYKIVAQDGDVINGSYPFAVATAVDVSFTSGAGGGQDPDAVRAEVAVARALLFLGVALALGGAVSAWTTRLHVNGMPGPRPLVRAGSGLALLAALGLLVDIVAGNWASAWGAMTSPGAARLVSGEAALLGVAVVTARRPWGGAVAVNALVGVVLLEGLRAHPGTAAGPLAVTFTAVHLVAASVWVGGLVHVLRIGARWRGRPREIRQALTSYARTAVAMFLLILATGSVMALWLLPTAQDWFATQYGRILLVKLAAVVAAAVAAMVARRWARLRQESGAPTLLGSAARMEAVLLVAVVAVTGTLTSVTPARLVPAASRLPAPTGTVLRAADRGGQVTVSLLADEKHVELRADVPAGEQPVKYKMLDVLSTASGVPWELALTSCGAGCWTAPVTWRDGTNRITARVEASGWTGGEVAIDVPWPLVAAPDVVIAMQRAMGEQSAIDVTESVDAGFGVTKPATWRMTGQGFMKLQPWALGGAVDPVLLRSDDAARVLSFALPALSYHYTVRLDQQNRIQQERVVTTKQELSRSFSYPAAAGK